MALVCIVIFSYRRWPDLRLIILSMGSKEMTTWDQEKTIKAWNFASRVHNGQLLPASDIPYINHLGLVAMEAMSAVTHATDIGSPDMLVLCALLHDTIEDTDTTFDQIEDSFGKEIACGVAALSKNRDLPSKQEQIEDSLQRIKQQPQEIWMVKLCDRITNLQPPPSHWNKQKIAAYRVEAELILNELGSANRFLANRLAEKIEGYKEYE